MNDYIAKPVDERILYSKILSLVKKPVHREKPPSGNRAKTSTSASYTNLAYLTGVTKANPVYMMEMLAIYIAQSPLLIAAMKKSVEEKDWKGLREAAHKMLPSISIMGMSSEYAAIAKQLQDYDGTGTGIREIRSLFLKFEKACTHACDELTAEFNKLKPGTS
jgi:HPt (histidine-containing phosphotransfer) domain-containing protein